MIQLVLEFYLPAIFAAAAIIVGMSALASLIFLARKSSRFPGRRGKFFHELLVVNLLTIPVLSFAILALLAIARSI